MQHTPGPWYLTDHPTGLLVQSAAINENNFICTVEGNTKEQALANARLIAAAPRLLVALQALARDADRVLHDTTDPQGWWEDLAEGIDLAHDVIANATIGDE